MVYLTSLGVLPEAAEVFSLDPTCLLLLILICLESLSPSLALFCLLSRGRRLTVLVSLTSPVLSRE